MRIHQKREVCQQPPVLLEEAIEGCRDPGDDSAPNRHQDTRNGPFIRFTSWAGCVFSRVQSLGTWTSGAGHDIPVTLNMPMATCKSTLHAVKTGEAEAKQTFIRLKKLKEPAEALSEWVVGCGFLTQGQAQLDLQVTGRLLQSTVAQLQLTSSSLAVTSPRDSVSMRMCQSCTWGRSLLRRPELPGCVVILHGDADDNNGSSLLAQLRLDSKDTESVRALTLNPQPLLPGCLAPALESWDSQLRESRQGTLQLPHQDIPSLDDLRMMLQ